MGRGFPRGRRGLALVASAVAALVAVATLAMVRTSADPERVWGEALADFEAGRWGRAEAGLARLAGLRAPTPRDHLLRARLWIARGRPDDALAALAEVPDADPGAASARRLAGQIEVRRGRLAAAERLLRDAIRLDPGLVQAHRELIYVYGKQLRGPELDARFRALSGLVALSFSDMYLWSHGRMRLWDPQLEAELSGFLAADPSDRWSRLALAEVHQRLGRLDEAEATLTPLPDSDPEALTLRARVASERLDFDGARRLLERGPAEHAGLARLRGALAMRDRDYDAAAARYRVAVRLLPDDREGLFGLAQALRLSGDAAGAAAAFDRLARWDELDRLLRLAGTDEGRADPTLPRRLGAACGAAGRPLEARGWYLVAIARDPLDAEAQETLHRITRPDPP